MLEKVIKRICICRHFPAMRLAESEYKMIEEQLLSKIEDAMATNFSFQISTTYKYLENYWCNFTQVIKSKGAVAWKNAFQELPVIVVASGPSLNKNIAELKECAKRAVIIASGTAIGALHKAGIIPHFLIVIDAAPHVYEAIKDFLHPDTILVATRTVTHKMVKNYPGAKCFVENFFEKENDSWEYLAKYLPETTWIKSAYSVTTGAVDFANYCGAKNIILVGQDLSFPSCEEKYAEGVKGGGNYDKWQLFKIPGYYGDEVDSNYFFKSIIDYYNIYVAQNSHIHFINATEGGALISSMTNMSLRDLREQLLNRELSFAEVYAPLHQKEEKHYHAILRNLDKILNQLKVLAEQVESFCSSQKKEMDKAINKQQMKAFVDFYQKIKKCEIYKYISSVMEIRIAFLKFQIADGMPLELQAQFYWNMTCGLEDLLQKMISWIEINVKNLREAAGRA